MNHRNGNYVIPPEIRALAPQDIPCRVEAQCYVPKKNNPSGSFVKVRYYVYEERLRNTTVPSQEGKPNGRMLLGKIMGGQFIPNQKGAERIAELRKPAESQQQVIVCAEPKERTERTSEIQDLSKSQEYIPRLKDIDPQIKNYGEYATVLASTKDVLANLQ